MGFSLVAFGSDLYCFSCFGYDKDGHTKCHTRDTGELFVRKCTSNTTCISYEGTYSIPQWVKGKMKEVSATVHGLYCGTHTECDRIECPNFWPKDITDKNCDVKCCHPSDKGECAFPLPTKDEIDRYNREKKNVQRPGGSVDNGNSPDETKGVGKSGVTSWESRSVWLQAITFAIVGLLKL